ncbi:MAG: sulfatase family protein [Oceanipulchritudo sp.]
MGKPPNILLLMADQLRADHLGWSPRSRMATPHFDRIAEGTAFTRCVTANPICSPARSALLTGRYTHQIGMLAMSGDLSREIPTYPQALQRAGYTTAGIGKFHWLQTWPWGTPRGQGVDLVAHEAEIKEYGFDHIWEASGKQLSVQNYCHYCRHLEQKGLLEDFRDHVLSRGKNNNEAKHVEFSGEPWPLPEEDYPDIVITDQLLDWLDRQDGEEPFFLFGSWLSPHQPHDPPRRYLDQIPYEEVDDFVHGEDQEPMDETTKKRMWKLRRSYKAMVRLLDDQMGRIFAKLEERGLLDNTVILFVSDHGEMLGDHGRFQKSIHWHQSTVVPCAIRHPENLMGRKVTTPVDLTDLTATILDLAGLDPRQALAKDWPRFNNVIPGNSLLPCVRGEADRIRDYAFSECQGEWSMIHSDRFSYVRYHDGAPDEKRELLFDLQADPDERHNLATDPAFSDQLTWHRARLFHILETTPPCQTRWAKYGD